MTNLASVLLYIGAFSVSTLLYRQYNKSNKRFYLLLSFITPLLLCALRFYVGTDYSAYYNQCKSETAGNIGFNIISHIANRIGDCKVLFSIYGAVTLIFGYLSLNNIEKKYRTLSLFLYLLLYFVVGFNIMKQTLAISIVLYAIKYIKKEKLLSYILLISLATIFHTTAIIAIFIYPILKIKKILPKFIIIVIFALSAIKLQSIVALLSYLPVLNHFAIYSDTSINSIGNNYTFYLQLLILIIFLIFNKTIQKNNTDYKQYLYIYIIGVILSFSGFLNPFIKRIALYFSSIEIFILPMISNISNKKRDKFIIMSIIVLATLIKFIISVYLLKQGNLVPYRTFIYG